MGKTSPINLTWLDQDEEMFEKSNSNSKRKGKAPVKFSRPLTRSQKEKSPLVHLVGNPTQLSVGLPGLGKIRTVP